MLKEAQELVKLEELPSSPSNSLFRSLPSEKGYEDIQVWNVEDDMSVRREPASDLNICEDQEIPTNEESLSRNHLNISDSEFFEDPPQENNYDQHPPEKSSFSLTVENASTKYRVSESTVQRKLEFETRDANTVQNMVNKIRKSHGKSEEAIIIDKLRCTLNSDFSFYLEIKTLGSEEYESYKTNAFKFKDLFHDLTSNIMDYFMTEESLTDYFMMVLFVDETDINPRIRQALKKFERSQNIPKGENRSTDTEAGLNWETIDEDYQLVKSYFDRMIDSYFAQYVEKTFERTLNSLKEALNGVRTLSDLEKARQALASNQSATTKEVFSLWVKALRLLATAFEGNEIYETSITTIVDRISADGEAFKLIWLMGFPQLIKDKVFKFLKQRADKLSLYAAKVQKAIKSRRWKKIEKSKENEETGEITYKKLKKY